LNFIVYKITNIINGKVYIGQTSKDIVNRFKQHCTKASKVPYLRNAIQKYGKSNFKIEQLGITDIESEVDLLEQHYISVYKSTNHEFGYNISTGGDHGIRGLKRSDETKAKMRANSFEMTGVDLAKLYCVSKWLVYGVLKENNCDY